MLIGITWLYASSLIGVNSTAKNYLIELIMALRADGFSPNLLVISGRR